jgi:hypothetical protein
MAKMLLLHMPTTTGGEKQVAFNADEILRMEEAEGGGEVSPTGQVANGTQIVQSDKGPTMVKESLKDILEALDEEVEEVKPKPEPKSQTGTGLHGQQPAPHGQAETRKGGAR